MKAFIIGYYGSDNIGDEVLLHQVIKMIHRIDETIEITSLSYRTHATQSLHNINCVSRNKYFEIIHAIRESDIVIGGGGSMLQNVTSNRSLYYYLALIRIAKFFNKKVILLGNGFGPITGNFYQKLTRKVLNKIDVFLARDEETVSRLKDIGVTSKVLLAADLAYYDYAAKPKIKSKRIAINLRPWENQEHIIVKMVYFIRRAISKGYKVEFLVMQTGKDDAVKEKLEKKLGQKIPLIENNLDNFILGYAEYTCLVGMRLHALIWAGIKDIPFIGIDYDPKITSYLQLTHQLSAGKADEVESMDIWKAFEELMENYEEKQKSLTRVNMEMKEKAELNYIALKELIEKVGD